MKEIQKPALTKQVQEGYSKSGSRLNQGGDNLMEVKPETPKLGVEKPSPVANKRATGINTLEGNKNLFVDVRRALEGIKQQGGSSQGAQDKLEMAMALEKDFPRPPLFGEPVIKVPPELEPFMSTAGDIVKNRRKDANLPKGVEVYNLNPVNLAGVTDPRLRQIGERINLRLAKGLLDYREADHNLQDMENVLSSLPPSSPDLAWAQHLHSELIDEVVRQREIAGEVNWEVAKNELLAATRRGDLKAIEDIVKEKYDFNERINVRDLVEVSLSDEAIAGKTYGYALEYVLESIINVADLTPLGTIPNPTFAQMENISRLIKGTLDKDQDVDKSFYRYLQQLQERRTLSHELYKSMSTRGAYQKYVGENLKNDGFDYLENKIVGVSETQGLWEKVLGQKVGAKREILSQREFDEAHEKVKRLFKKDAKLDADGTSHKLKKRFEIHKPGQSNPILIERPLREWEINRAATVGRVIAHVSGRAITYGTLGDLPEATTSPDELWDSMNAEYVARITAAMKSLAKRFLGGYSASSLYIDKWVENKIKIATEKGQIYGESKGKKLAEIIKEKTLYGQRIESWIYLDTSVPDLKSHGWRNRKLQLKNEKFARIDTKGTTIGKYLDREWKGISDLKAENLDSELAAIGSLTLEEQDYLDNKKTIRISKSDRIKNILYSRKVEKTVLNQRLYLSALSREGHFTPMLKEEIWKKVSGFLPSRIAAFFPEERANITKSNGAKMSEAEWEELSDKLFIAEMDRTREQQERVARNDFSEVSLSQFYATSNITSDEIVYINKIIALGEIKSKMLSNMIFPQSAFLDDAPEPAWMNLGVETVGRLLVNDYEGYDAANKGRNEIIGRPTMRLGESAEHLIKAKDGYAIPIGVPDAQDRLEADILTRYDLYSMNTSSKAGLYFINRWIRHPTSLIEKHNIDANISMDEKAIFDDVNFLAQNEVVGNNRTQLDFAGHTQSERIKRKAKANLRNVWLRHLRLFAMIFPGAFGVEFLKMIAPDMVKGK